MPGAAPSSGGGVRWGGVDGFQMGIDNRRGLGPRDRSSLLYKLLVIGQMLPTGSVEPLTAHRITSENQGEALFGRGSMLAEMLRYARKANSFLEVWAIGQQELVDGVAAAGSITVSTAATSAGTLALYIAGERGLLLRSSDGGQHFAVLASPYEGSFFGLLAARDGLLAYGLRGNAWWSSDRGATWQELQTGVESALAAALELADGRLLLAGQGGELLFAEPQGGRAQSAPMRLAPGLAALAEAADGSLTSAGLSGLAARQTPK